MLTEDDADGLDVVGSGIEINEAALISQGLHLHVLVAHNQPCRGLLSDHRPSHLQVHLFSLRQLREIKRSLE